MSDAVPRNRQARKLTAGEDHARGEGFFSAEETFPYKTPYNLTPQFNDDSCTAAVCRMLLRDEDDTSELPETYLSDALNIDTDGAFVSAMPKVLRDFNLKTQYQYRNDLTLADLQKSLLLSPSVVAVRRPKSDIGHVLIVDEIEDGFVLVRDSLPRGKGSSYKVALNDFLAVWLRSDKGSDEGDGIGLVIGVIG